MTHPEGEYHYLRPPVAPYSWEKPTDGTVAEVRHKLTEGEVVYDILAGIGLSEGEVTRDLSYIDKTRSNMRTNLASLGNEFPIPRAVKTSHVVIVEGVSLGTCPALALVGHANRSEYVIGRGLLIAGASSLLTQDGLPMIPNRPRDKHL